MNELKLKIKEALVSALPVTAIVYLMALTPLFEFSRAELITFTIGAVMLVVGIGMFNLGAGGDEPADYHSASGFPSDA